MGHETPEAQARWIENFRYLVGKIASDPRFTTVTSDDLRDNYFTEERRVTLDTLMAVKPQIDEELFPVTLPESLALTDILYACRDLLLGKKEHLCERIYGFLDTPYATDAPVTLTREALVAMAKQIPDGFLPTALTYGDTVIGPADFLRAALTLLTEEKEEVTVLPGPWQVDLDQFPISRDLDLAGTWMHSPDFKDEFVSKRIRLQLWTVSLPRGTERKIY